MNLHGFSRRDRLKYVPVIRRNLIRSLIIIIQNMDDINIRLADPDAHQIAEKFKTVAMDVAILKKQEVSPAKLRELRKLALRLMQDPGVRQCFACSYEFYLPDSAEYFSHRVSASHWLIGV